MKLNELYGHWQEYKVAVDFVAGDEHIRGELPLGLRFSKCFWSEDEEFLLFYLYDNKNSKSMLRCNASGDCHIKDPRGNEDESFKDKWFRIGRLVKIEPKPPRQY